PKRPDQALYLSWSSSWSSRRARALGWEPVQEPLGGGPDLLHGGVESLSVGWRRGPETADLADELEGRRSDLLIRGGRRTPERLDAATHTHKRYDDSVGSALGSIRRCWSWTSERSSRSSIRTPSAPPWRLRCLTSPRDAPRCPPALPRWSRNATRSSPRCRLTCRARAR